MTKPLRTFIIYAREDRDAVDEVRRHLKQAEKKNLLTIWDDGEILPGAYFRHRYSQNQHHGH